MAKISLTDVYEELSDLDQHAYRRMKGGGGGNPVAGGSAKDRRNARKELKHVVRENLADSEARAAAHNQAYEGRADLLQRWHSGKINVVVNGQPVPAPKA